MSLKINLLTISKYLFSYKVKLNTTNFNLFPVIAPTVQAFHPHNHFDKINFDVSYGSGDCLLRAIIDDYHTHRRLVRKLLRHLHFMLNTLT